MRDKLAQLGRLWRTVRWLKLTQVVGRLRLRLPYPRPDLRPAPPRRSVAGCWISPAARESSLLGPTRLFILGEEHDVAEVGWDNPGLALLWRYNLHYFDDLNACDARLRLIWQRALLQRWMDENPPGRGTAWAPYPVSLRIVNWIKWSLGGQVPEPEWLASLAVQVRWLSRRLEWHLLGNHLFVNAKALVFAGLFFEGPEADGWLVTGLSILRRELPEQILADGGQFERSPMYHVLALEDLLDLLNVIAACAPPHSPARSLVPELHRLSCEMLHWLRCMRHPDGALARFNDTAEGISPPTEDLERYSLALGVTASAAPGEGVRELQPSGYVRVQHGAMVAFIDAAPIGPDYLPGHAHADTLSFELSLRGRQLIVNRGTSVYGNGPRRQWERGTAAHSTVQIGAHDSSEVWAGFRVGRRAKPQDVRVEGAQIEAAHDGYRHLPGGPTHQRRWQLDDHAMLVQDRVAPETSEAAIARWHFAPGLTLIHDTAARWRVIEKGGELAQLEVLEGDAHTSTTQHAQRFGQLADATTLNISLVDGKAAARLTWIA